MTRLVLEAAGLTVTARYADARVAVLRDIGFRLERGKVLGLVGESGAGKSMLGRVVAANLPTGFRVESGSLALEGEDLVRATAARRRELLGARIAFIPQEPLTALNPSLTIAAQFGEHLTRLGVALAARREAMLAALTAVRLREPAGVLAQYPFQLSGGMCQRVLIAMAFAARPALVVADEPTTALDVSTQATIVELIRALQRDHGTSLLFITHDLRLASRVCDDIAVLHAGDMVERGPAVDVANAPHHPYARALVAANPRLRGPRRRLVSLPEQMPGIAAFATLPGCRFAPRCAVRDAACANAVPPLIEMAPGHVVRAAVACRAASAAALAPEIAVPAAAGDIVLSIERVAKAYPAPRNWLGRRGRETVALARADLEVHAGEFVGIVGESGSGKSTLARLVMGLEAPTSGRITLDGIDVTDVRAPAARQLRLDALQIVFQDPQSALNPRRTVASLVTQAMEAGYEVPRTEREARARTLLRETGLPLELLTRYPSQLSGGQKQRVNIARALCITPRLLVADEIISGLDVSVQAQILNLLLDLRRDRNVALLFISHDLASVRYLCSRIVVMQNGHVVESGETDAVLEAPQHPYTRALLAAVPPDDPRAPWPLNPNARAAG